MNGKPYYESWDDFFNRLFDHFDLNKDGTLSKEEAERCPNVNFLQQHLSGNLGFGQQGGQTAKMAEMDKNKDGKVTREEFVLYYLEALPPVRFNSMRNGPRMDLVTDIIYTHLTGQKDGKLTAESLAKAESAFSRLDDNEDELISREELLQGATPDQRGGGVLYAPGQRGKLSPNEPLVQLVPGQPLDGPIQQLLATYAKAKKDKVSRSEIGLPKELFDELDVNKDDHLDAAELVKFFRRNPDLEMMVKVGKPAQKETLTSQFVSGLGRELGYNMAKEKQIELFNPREKPLPLAAAYKQVDPTSADLTLGDAKIELNALALGQNQFNRFQNVRQFYLEEFKNADTEKKNVLDRKQVMKTDFLKEIFRFADRDNDGKLTLAELTEYLNLQALGSACFVTVNLSDQGRDLFELIDSNHDNQLSMRELREAWGKLKPLTKDGTSLAQNDIPRRFQASFGQGNTFFGNVRQNGPPKMPRGPVWFRKMDRNGDGDVSLKEWLGTEEQFRLIDEDGDGLISLAEAERYEAKVKKEK